MENHALFTESLEELLSYSDIRGEKRDCWPLSQLDFSCREGTIHILKSKTPVIEDRL